MALLDKDRLPRWLERPIQASWPVKMLLKTPDSAPPACPEPLTPLRLAHPAHALSLDAGQQRGLHCSASARASSPRQYLCDIRERTHPSAEADCPSRSRPSDRVVTPVSGPRSLLLSLFSLFVSWCPFSPPTLGRSTMKAGAFGRPPERRQVQPGGRVLPGMFASPSPSPAPAAAPTTSSRQAPTSTAAQPKLANPGGALLSSWGTAGRSSGRLPATTAPSRLERLASGRGSSDGGSDGPTRGGNAASISRARKLGLNRRARTPSPPSSPEYSPERSPPRSPSPPPSHQRARAASQAASSPFTRQRDRAASASPPPGTRPRRASSPPPVAAAPVAPGNEAGEQPQGLLSSLWGRATQLVGGSAAGQQPGVVREVGHNRANSVDSSLPVPQSHVTPFQLHDGAHAGDEHESHVAPTPKEPSTLRNTRPIALPPLVAPARTLTTSSTPAARRISAPPGLARAASEPLPPIEPITYHRPPPLHPRDAPPPSSLRRRTAAHTSPYDWLESRDEAPLEPFLFTRALGRAPTKRGGRAARRPAMPQGVRTEPGPRGAAEGIAAGGLVGAAAAGGMAAARAHAQVHARCARFLVSGILRLRLPHASSMGTQHPAACSACLQLRRVRPPGRASRGASPDQCCTDSVCRTGIRTFRSAAVRIGAGTGTAARRACAAVVGRTRRAPARCYRLNGLFRPGTHELRPRHDGSHSASNRAASGRRSARA